MTEITPLRFGDAETRAASDEWGFNCGPGALCAALGMTPAELRPHMLDFESKHYTNPTLMFGVLKKLGIEHRVVHRSDDFMQPTVWPVFGLCRVQWHGPWMKPGVPMKARYRQTHWIAVHGHRFSRCVFDINALEADGWIPFSLWAGRLVPWLLEMCVPKADGRWHITHSIELT